jgi:hypothetical protein
VLKRSKGASENAFSVCQHTMMSRVARGKMGSPWSISFGNTVEIHTGNPIHTSSELEKMKAGVRTRLHIGGDLSDSMKIAKMNARCQEAILSPGSHLSSFLHKQHKSCFRPGIGHNKTCGTFGTRRQPSHDQNRCHMLHTQSFRLYLSYVPSWLPPSFSQSSPCSSE